MFDILKVWLPVVVAIAAVLAGYQRGYSNARAVCEAEKSAALAQAVEAHTRAIDAGKTVEIAAEKKLAATQKTFEKLKTEAIKNANARPAGLGNCGLDADGLRLWNAANHGDDALSAAVPAAGLRPVATPGNGKTPGHAPQPHRDGAGLPRLPGAAPGAGGLDQRDDHSAGNAP
jgi:hypothetical protein